MLSCDRHRDSRHNGPGRVVYHTENEMSFITGEETTKKYCNIIENCFFFFLPNSKVSYTYILSMKLQTKNKFTRKMYTNYCFRY